MSCGRAACADPSPCPRTWPGREPALLSLCCLLPVGEGPSATLLCKGRTPRGGNGEGLSPGQWGKGEKVGTPQLLLNQRPTSNRSSVSNKNPKFGSLSVKTEPFLSEKQNCLKAATQSSLGLNDSSSNTEKTLHGYKNIYTNNGHVDLCPTAPSRGCAKGQWHLHHQEQECCCES